MADIGTIVRNRIEYKLESAGDEVREAIRGAAAAAYKALPERAQLKIAEAVLCRVMEGQFELPPIRDTGLSVAEFNIAKAFLSAFEFRCDPGLHVAIAAVRNIYAGELRTEDDPNGNQRLGNVLDQWIRAYGEYRPADMGFTRQEIERNLSAEANEDLPDRISRIFDELVLPALVESLAS